MASRHIKPGLPLLVLWLSMISFVLGQQGSTCSATSPCIQGCCSSSGFCGYTEAYCGAGCQSNCDAKAECGTNSNQTLCPLGVCCSPYGFCGTTELFCGTGCQNGCAPVPTPSCPGASTNPMDFKRRVAYYELFGILRPCDTMQPEAIPAGALTHLNLAFAEFDSNFKIIDSQGDIVARVSRLKAIYPQLRVNIAIGGWNFNDPPTEAYWSNMVSTAANRATFLSSLALYMLKYGLDGVDLDWEYPGAADRGGGPADTENYVALVTEMRTYFNALNPGWEISVTLPSSYWYMRGFDLRGLERPITYFNFLSYDLHGEWDFYNNYTGPFLRGQTNLTEIDEGFSLLWRNNIDPSKVVMGMAFYGRSFTMANPDCNTADCQFSQPGIAGDCSQTPGILIYPEITSGNGTINAETYYDPESTVKYTVFDYSQWVSYDDEQSWSDKLKYLAESCLSGLMIWAIDQDTPQYDALNGLLGPGAAQGALLQGGNLSSAELDQLASDFAAYTGQNCYLTPVCTNGTQAGPGQVCAAGYTSVSTQHGFAQIYPGDEYTLDGFCSVGWFRHICCPTNALPQNCEWINEPPAGSTACGNRTCGISQFELSSDDFATAGGDTHTCQGPGGTGERRLCCDSTEVLDQCFWTTCQGPFDDSYEQEFVPPPLTCPSGTEVQTYRYDNGQGSFCANQFNSPNTYAYAMPFCCPTNEVPQNCSWSNNPNQNPDVIPIPDPEGDCVPRPCSPGTVKITTAMQPPNSSLIYSGVINPGQGVNCAAYQPPPGGSLLFPYCCNPPTAYNESWPVPPSYLWSDAYSDTGADVQWAYADNWGNNNMDSAPDPEHYGDDPYGFIMLDGPEGSLQSTFSEDYTFTHEAHVDTNVRRSLLTTNLTHLDQVFVHKEETAYVYCNHPVGSPQCQKIFFKGAKDTIIRLPAHAGSGPFARVVSMEFAEPSYRLAPHHIRAREVELNRNPVYKLKYDYDFHLIKRAETVNMRVDYTNLQDYWAQLTDSPASRKRSVNEHHLSQAEWKDRVRTAKDKHWQRKAKREEARKSKEKYDRFAARAEKVQSHVPTKLGKRWFGSFVNWLKKLNTVENSAVGYLNMIWSKSALLYRAKAGCPTSTAYASLSIYLDSNVNLEATYAYYFSGTIVPPAITGTYAYFGLQPSAYVGVSVVGYAQMQYQSQRQKLIQTISYPGLAIQGIAAVGPTLDVWGQIKGLVTLSGQMQIGFRFNFEKQEWYWPEDSDSASYQELLGLSSQPESVPTGITPEFSASVQANAQLDILITPEANMGIKVGGGSLVGTLVNAQIVGYVNTTTRFAASAGASSSGSYNYGYSVSFLYNVGYGAVAQIPLFPWYATFNDLYNPPKEIVLYSSSVSSSNAKVKRSWSEQLLPVPQSGLLNSMSESDTLSNPSRYPVIIPKKTRAQLEGAVFERDNFSMPDDGSLFGKRQQANPQTTGDVPDFSLSQLFTCPDTKGCAACGCSTPTKRGLESRADTPPPTCPSTLPDFRVNCNIFSQSQLNHNGNNAVVYGICDGQNTFLTALGLNQAGIVLTYDGGNTEGQARTATRRNQACRGNPCAAVNTQLDRTLGTGANLVSCDEFPFAIAEEGGNYYGTVVPGFTVQRTCTPDWQQTMQGTCNGLLGNIQTNVLYHDLQNTQNPVWVGWNDQRWFNADGTTPVTVGENQIFPREALYPTAQYQGVGPATGNNLVSWMFKRNFTYGLAFPAQNGAAAWASDPANQFMSWKIQGGGSLTDATQVVCAVNLFGQNSIYRNSGSGGFNGYCVIGSLNEGVYGTIPVMRSCIITWATGGGSTTKRDEPVGSFGDWNIESIQIDENAPDIYLHGAPEDWSERLGPQLPYEKIRRSGA